MAAIPTPDWNPSDKQINFSVRVVIPTKAHLRQTYTDGRSPNTAIVSLIATLGSTTDPFTITAALSLALDITLQDCLCTTNVSLAVDALRDGYRGFNLLKLYDHALFTIAGEVVPELSHASLYGITTPFRPFSEIGSALLQRNIENFSTTICEPLSHRVVKPTLKYIAPAISNSETHSFYNRLETLTG